MFHYKWTLTDGIKIIKSPKFQSTHQIFKSPFRAFTYDYNADPETSEMQQLQHSPDKSAADWKQWTLHL